MKSGLRRLQISRFRLSQYGHSPQACELHLTLPERLGAGRRRRIGRTRRSPEPVGEAKNDVVRPYIGIQRSAALEVGIVDCEAEFVVSEGGDIGAEPVFDTDQTLNVDAGQLIFESIRLADARTPDLDVRH